MQFSPLLKNTDWAPCEEGRGGEERGGEEEGGEGRGGGEGGGEGAEERRDITMTSIL